MAANSKIPTVLQVKYIGMLSFILISGFYGCLDDFLSEKLGPLLLAPGAGNFVRDETIEENGGRDVDAVLPAELDCTTTSVPA